MKSEEEIKDKLMNQVEKLYKNCNLRYYYCGDDYVAESMLEFECTDGNKEKCKTCDKAKTNHPPFTAEKQIELYCFILSQDKYTMTFEATLPLTPDVFAEGIAEAVNRIWQDLTEEEHKQIEEILR